MIFNTTSFCIFFIVVFFLYYFPLKEKTKAQNWLLLLSSYLFYGFTDLKLISLLLVATIIFFALGIAIDKSKDPKKALLLKNLGIISGVGLLFYFKYFNFFITSFSSLLNGIGLKTNIGTLNIIMPLGISFFTFKLISYVIEIYRGKIEPCIDFISFSVYIAFFSTILSGPIDRPNTFIPQLQNKRHFNYGLTVDGCKQFLWGLFQKIVIADNLAVYINKVWSDIPNQTGIVLIITAVFYSIQMYTDFSGYSNMAIGIGKILGFNVSINFKYPFFARNVSEFWRNWHISLTSWLTDYVFMPLNIKFRIFGNLGIILAIIINFLIVGIWHGANWTFAVFGLYHGLLFIPLILSGSFLKKKKLKVNKYGLPTLIDFNNMVGTFFLVSFGLVIFRANNIGQALEYFSGILDISCFNLHSLRGIFGLYRPIIFSALMFIMEWYSRDQQYAIANFGINRNKYIRYAMYYAIIFAIFALSGNGSRFIYFQF
jgi:alginate O-acetyltransferase complex protein AlgI